MRICTAFFRRFGGNNVAYIDQDAASKGSFTFKMRDTLKPGDNEEKEYTALIGGTGVAIAKTATFKLGTAAAGKTTYSISGTVGDVPNYLSDASLAEIYKTTITVQDTDYNPIGDPIVVDVSSIGDFEVGYAPFTISDLTIGEEYIITFDRVGVCAKDVILESTIADDKTDIVVNLLATDMNDDFFITADDIDIMVSYLNTGDYDDAADSNLDGYITADDIDMAVTALNGFDNYTMTIK